MADELATTSTTFSLKDLDLTKNCPYMVVAETGVKVSTFPFEKIKFQEGRKSRISLITNEVICVKLHYKEELGYFFCTGGRCCEVCDKAPSVRYCYPVVVYNDINENGRPISQSISIKLLSMNRENYDQIVTLADLKGDVSQFDIIVSCNSTQYQKIALTEAGPALWKSNKNSVEYVMNYMKQNAKNLTQGIGKIYTDDKIDQLLGESSAPKLDDTNLDDIFK